VIQNIFKIIAIAVPVKILISSGTH
jgi:hypothetical protein